jgi:hypothetical protein
MFIEISAAGERMRLPCEGPGHRPRAAELIDPHAVVNIHGYWRVIITQGHRKRLNAGAGDDVSLVGGRVAAEAVDPGQTLSQRRHLLKYTHNVRNKNKYVMTIRCLCSWYRCIALDDRMVTIYLP